MVKVENWSPVFLVQYGGLYFVNFRVENFGELLELSSQSHAKSLWLWGPVVFVAGIISELVFNLVLSTEL